MGRIQSLTGEVKHRSSLTYGLGLCLWDGFQVSRFKPVGLATVGCSCRTQDTFCTMQHCMLVFKGNSRCCRVNDWEEVRRRIRSISTPKPIITHNLPEINHRWVITMSGQVPGRSFKIAIKELPGLFKSILAPPLRGTKVLGLES